MHWKSLRIQVFTAIFSIAVIPACAQVVPQGEHNTSPFTVGVGVSDFATDWGSSRMVGITATLDWRLPFRARLLRDLEMEAEGRELDWFKPSGLNQLRQETGLGGAKYTFYRHRRAGLYAKFLAGFGGVYFPPSGTYSHDTRTVLAPGGGIDFRVGHGISVRADYEYQYWHALFGPHDLTPNGVTVGATYNFGARHN